MSGGRRCLSAGWSKFSIIAAAVRRRWLPSAVAEAVVASIIATAGGGVGWGGGCGGVGASLGRRWGPVGRCLQWQVEVARVAGPL